MSNRLTTCQTTQWLRERDNFLIITHKRPDGDTLGSAGALALGLRESGKNAYIQHNAETTPRYAPYVEKSIAPENFDFDYIIVVDTASTDLFPDNAKPYADMISLSIDHHRSNTEYAENLCLDTDAAACGEIIYSIVNELNNGVTSEIATCLYVSLSTDTGCFSFANTTSNTFTIAGILASAGAPIDRLNRILFRSKTKSRVKLEGLLTSGMEFFFDGKLAIATITTEMLKNTNATEDDMDNISEIPSGIEGVCVGITIREQDSEFCKLSVRSIAPYNSNDICSHFGGGGHKFASGAKLKQPVDKVVPLLLEVLKDFF